MASETIEFGETHGVHPAPIPKGLDLIKIDERWAQVYRSSPAGVSACFLDDGTGVRIILNEYDLARIWNRSIRSVRDEVSLTAEEVSRVIWGSEQKAHPNLIEEVRVFGKFIKKTVTK